MSKLKHPDILPLSPVFKLQNFNGFVAFRSHKLNAVDCFSMDRMEKLSKQIDDTLDPFSIERDSIESAVFADAVILRFDKDGRIIIPEALLNHAAIEEKISFVGLGATFQLWNPRAFEEHQNLVRAKLKNKVTV